LHSVRQIGVTQESLLLTTALLLYNVAYVLSWQRFYRTTSC